MFLSEDRMVENQGKKKIKSKNSSEFRQKSKLLKIQDFGSMFVLASIEFFQESKHKFFLPSSIPLDDHVARPKFFRSTSLPLASTRWV